MMINQWEDMHSQNSNTMLYLLFGVAITVKDVKNGWYAVTDYKDFLKKAMQRDNWNDAKIPKKQEQ